MTLSAGKKLGPYEIVSALGSGGMGEVYRARDSRLGRDVAVKVLPERLAADSDAAARFEREAKAVAALSHPNILAIHDIGRDEETAYAVTELLEGSTLRDRLEGGPLPFRKCIEYGVQIAEGLAAAHEKEIVHRDLKPENVFVTGDGRIKILDFGLAKGTVARADEDTQSPTAAQPTDPGTVLGTVGYMSPEQVRGRPADARSDIFSLGAVLYEMATGRRAFKGDSAIETMNAVLKEDPPEISTIRGLPPEFERVVRHCLEKSPGERFQSARDIVFDLKAMTADSSIRSRAVAGRIHLRRWVPVAVAIVVAAAAAGAFFLGQGLGERRVRANPPSYKTLTFRRGTILNARFASDGRTVVYSAAWQGEPATIYTVRATAPESQKLDLPPAMLYAVSKLDELAIGLDFHYTTGYTSEATLARASLSGGAPRSVAERVAAADWSPDGSQLALARFAGKQCQLEFPVGHVLFKTDGWIDELRISPNGDRIAFAEHPRLADTAGSVTFVDLEGHATRVARDLTAVASVSWAKDGREIWWSGARRGNVGAVFASDTSGHTSIVSRSGASDEILDVSPSGGALIARKNGRREMEFSGPTGERDLSWLDWSYPNDISADGRTILFMEQGESVGSQYAIYLRRTDGSPAVQLGQGAALDLSPDGRFVTVLRDTDAGPRLVFLPTGAGQTREVDLHGLVPWRVSWLPDGSRLLVSQLNAATGVFRTMKLDGTDARTIPSPPMQPYCYAVSSDGQTIAGVRLDGRLALVPVAGGASRAANPAGPAAPCVLSWTGDGLGILYKDGAAMPARIHRLTIATGRDEIVREVAPQDRAGVQAVWPVLITPDGKSVVYSYRRILDELLLVEGLR